MIAVIGFILYIVGWSLLAFGLLIPAYLGSSFWQILLGFCLTIGGYLVTDYSGSGCLIKLSSLFLAILGIVLLIASIVSLIVGFGLYGIAGAIVRIIIGFLLIGFGFIALQFRGSLATSSSEDEDW